MLLIWKKNRREKALSISINLTEIILQDGLFNLEYQIKFIHFDFETGNYKYYANHQHFVEEKKTFTVNATDSNGDKDPFDGV